MRRRGERPAQFPAPRRRRRSPLPVLIAVLLTLAGTVLITYVLLFGSSALEADLRQILSVLPIGTPAPVSLAEPPEWTAETPMPTPAATPDPTPVSTPVIVQTPPPAIESQPLPEPETLLMLVNREHRITEDYQPPSLVYLIDVCPADVVTIKGKDIQGDPVAVNALIKMLRGAIAEGIGDWQVSAGYRTYAYQQRLFDDKVASLRRERNLSRTDAISAAGKTVALPGASEHHTGLTFDLTVPGVSFAGTKQANWLAVHCHEYGYILRYQSHKEAITGYIAEAWHFRYVGREAARIMVENDWCLEEYIDHYGQ